MSIYKLYFASICDVMLERQRDRQRDRLTGKKHREIEIAKWHFYQ